MRCRERSRVTDDDRRARVAEIFQLLDGVPADAADERIALCREALGLMTPDEAASEAGGWLEFEAGKAYYRRSAGPDPVADLGAAIGAFIAALATWTPREPAGELARRAGQPGRRLFRPATAHRAAGREHAALDAFRATLTVLDPRRSPVDWAQALEASASTICSARTGTGPRSSTRLSGALSSQGRCSLPWD